MSLQKYQVLLHSREFGVMYTSLIYGQLVCHTILLNLSRYIQTGLTCQLTYVNLIQTLHIIWFNIFVRLCLKGF